MKRKIIINVFDDELRISRVFNLLNTLGYDDEDFDSECLWSFDDNHTILADKTKVKNGVKFDIWKEVDS